MATANSKVHCVKCGKERATSKCGGCSQDFCYKHLTDHRQELSEQLDEIEVNRDVFRQTLTQQTNDLTKHSLIEEIDKWEEDSIRKIQQTANECKQLVLQHSTAHINQIEINLTKLTDELREIRKENDFNEIDLQHLKQKLAELIEQLNEPLNISFQQNPSLLVDKISVLISSRKYLNYI
jgi:uncharacterized damage-inducible protein DinB